MKFLKMDIEIFFRNFPFLITNFNEILFSQFIKIFDISSLKWASFLWEKVLNFQKDITDSTGNLNFDLPSSLVNSTTVMSPKIFLPLF